jgi:LacI family transcriptional regulator
MKLSDVAKKARVSAATVSRVLNEGAGVRESTRLRVLKAVAELNYRPNLHARSLAARGANRTLGMVVSNLGNPYFYDIYRAVEESARRDGYEILLADTGYLPEQLAASLDSMLGQRVAGLAVIVSEMGRAVVERLAAAGVPVVVSGVETPGHAITNIRVNCRRGMERLLEYLQSLGHRRMAFVGHHSQLESIDERKKAFLDTAKRRARHVETLVFTDSDSFAGGRQAARDLLASGFEPTAVICVNDQMAVGVLKEFSEQGRRVPRDVSVTGFDNTGLAEYAAPALTTVHIPRQRIGEAIYKHLVGGEEFPAGRDLVIDTELVLRESTGPVPAS